MGWLSSVICLIAAGICLYNYIRKGRLQRERTSQGTEALEKSSISSSDIVEPQDQSAADRLLAIPNMTVTIAEPPPLDVSEPSNTVNTRVEAPKTMMPPPPPSVSPTPRISAPSASSMLPPSRPKSPPRLKPPTVGAPPRPGGGALRPPPSMASSLRVPPQKVLSNTSMAPSSLQVQSKKSSKQVALEPGHSPLDWANLTANPNSNLRGKDAPDHLIKITPSQLKAQSGRKGTDAWTVYQGKVYNITPYVPFHPGGKGEILRGAGKDSAKLFMEVHPWVNWDGMLAECMVGILVSEEERKEENGLDEMD